MFADLPPLKITSTVVYADVIVVSAWRNKGGVYANLALADGRDVTVWIPLLQRLPVRYRASTLKALDQIETWTDTDQAPLSDVTLFFNLKRSHASVQLLRTKAGLVLSWLKRYGQV